MTFDQRGFGDSGGQANVQDPEIEGRDIQTLLDWAESTLSPHLAYLRGDPLVGGLGVSYGGGFQLVGASVDPRFDALVPVITWHDLSYSLSADQVPKTLWLSVLTGAAAADQAPWVTAGYLESLSGTTSEATSQRLTIEGEALLDPRVFVGLGVRRLGRLSPELLHDQVLPMRGTGARQTELVGVSTRLGFGDEVGLMLYGFHPQYALGFSRLPSAVRLKGQV